MTRAERQTWEARRDEYEEPIIEKARAAGRLPVIDCTVPGYPLPPHVVEALRRAADPDARERAYREAAGLRRKATSLRSLALVMERDAAEASSERDRKKHLVRARDMVAKAAEHDARAAALATDPLSDDCRTTAVPRRTP